MATGQIKLISDNAYMATHVIQEDSKVKHLERVTFGSGILSLPSSPQISVVSGTGYYPGTAYSIAGKNALVCKTTYSNNNISSTVRVAFYDDSDVLIGFTEEVIIDNTGLSDGPRYVGDMLVVSNDCGASSVKLYIEAPTPSGNISVFMGCI